MDQTPPIEVDYELKESDLAAFARYVGDSRINAVSDKAKHFKKIWFILLPVILVVGVILSDSHFAGVLLVFFALVGLQEIWHRWYWKTYYQIFAKDASNKETLGKRKIILRKDFFLDIRPFRETRLAWQGIYDLVFTSEHIFIRTCAERAFVVPMRVFKNSAEAKLFGETLEELWKAGRNISSDSPSNVSAG
jgi:hypothetical protein